MSKILIVEDDANILRLEKDYLEANGFEAVAATDGMSCMTLANNESFDLILLDVMLPGIDGFKLCKQLRNITNVPIIFVSAKRDEIDKITGLGYGADDYIVKPFSPGELVARVNAHINRYNALTEPNKKPGSVLTIDGIELNSDTGEVTVNGVEVTLTKKEFQVLFILASKPTEIFSKNELFENVWGYDSLGDTSTLTVHINRLREKLKEVSPETNYIKTIWGRGYKFK